MLFLICASLKGKLIYQAYLFTGITTFVANGTKLVRKSDG